MPRFDIDEDSPLYTGPPALSAGNNDLISPKDLAPPAPPQMPTRFSNPATPAFPKPSSDSIAATMQAFQNAPNIGVDQFKMAKSGVANFRNPEGGNNFYNRYNTTGMRDVYDKLGFSPFRDNDEVYNKHASMWDDFQRAGAQSFQNAKVAFFQDHFGKMSDRDAAKAQQKAMAIGTSTKGGVVGWTANAGLNLGYTFGVMAELAVEEIALGIAETGLIAATGATFGAAAPLAAANAGVMAGRATRAFGKIGSAWKTAGSLRRSLANLKDASKARTFFKNAGNFINPLEKTTAFLKKGKAWGTATNLERFATVTRGAGQFYGDVQNVRLAYGEGALEGGHVQIEKENEFYDAFIENKGRTPNKEEAVKIRTLAQQAGEATAIVNMPFIMYSNKLLFDGLVRPKKPVMDIFSVKGRDILFDPKKAVTEAYSKMPSWFSKQAMYIRNPRMVGRKLKDYTASSFPEGLQELGQEIISGSTGDIYADKYQAQFEGNAERGGLYSFIADNVKQQASVEGFETFMSGFLIPAMIGPVTNNLQHVKNSKKTLSDLSMRWSDPKEWTRLKGNRESALNETVEKLNQFYADPTKYLNSDLNNMQLQTAARQAENDAEEAGDTKGLHDIKDASGMDHVLTALEMGRFDTTMQRLADMKNISAEDIAESYPHLTQEKFNNILDKNIERGNKIKARWDFTQERFVNPFDSQKFKVGTKEHTEEAIQESAWNDARNELIYNQTTFDRALERSASILETAHTESGLSKTPFSQFNALFNIGDATKELEILKQEASALDGEFIDPSQKKLAKEKQKSLELLSAYTEALDTGLGNTLDEVMPADDVAALQKAFNNYTKHIAKVNGDHIKVDKMQETFKKVMDVNMLTGRADAANSAVNKLLDPKNFLAQQKRTTNVFKQLVANKENEIKKSLQDFIKAMDKNDMLNELYEAGAFFDPKDLLKLEEEGIVPNTFYSVAKEGHEIAASSEEYGKAMSILRKYLKTGSLTNIDTGLSGDPYNTTGRDKLKNDKRTLEDYAKQYGFDIDAPQTKVPLIQVLQTIADKKNKNSTAREKELARKLMEVADKNYFVNFVTDQTQAGTYSEVTQTVIDARWSSHDYKQGREGAALEEVILKQEMHRIASEAVSKDASFKKEMSSLMQEARMKYDMLSAEDKASLQDSNKREFEGLSTPEGFVAEAMSNEKFQKFLGTVTTRTDASIQTGWKAFVDKVLRRINLLLNGTPNGTVLNTAMNLITAKIDSMYSSITPKAGKAGETIKETIRPDAISRETSMAELRSKHPDFAKSILAMYKAENEAKAMRGDALLDDDYLNKNDEQIYTSPVFLNWFKSPYFKKKEDAIKAYNLTVPKPGQQTSGVEAKKADIEKRRQEEIGTKESRSFTDDDGITWTVTLSENKDGKITRTKGEKNGKIIGQIENKYPKELSNEKIYETENVEGHDYSIIEKVKVEGKRTDKINAKYDAELAALESQSTSNASGTTSAKEDVTDAEYAEFELNGFVSRIRIITIAEKVKNKEALSQKEKEIQNAKEQEIQQYIDDSVAAVPSHINRDMQTKLRALGYRKSSKKATDGKTIIKGWDAMGPAEAWKIVYQGLTREERTEIELADQAAIREELAQQRLQIRAEVQNEIDSAETYEEVMAVRTELLSELSNNPLLSSAAGFKSTELENLIDVRLDQIKLSVTFDKVTEGMTIILNDGRNTPAEVISKDNTGKFMVVAPVSDLTQEEFIKEDEMEEKVKYINSTALQNSEVEEEGSEITDEDNKTSNESVEKASEIVTSPEFMDRAFDQSDTDNNWEDEINTCE